MPVGRPTSTLSPTKPAGPQTQMDPEDWRQVDKGTGLHALCQITPPVCLLCMGPSQHQAHQEPKGYPAERCSLDPEQVLRNFKCEQYVDSTGLAIPAIQMRRHQTLQLQQLPPCIDQHQQLVYTNPASCCQKTPLDPSTLLPCSILQKKTIGCTHIFLPAVLNIKIT